MSSKWKVSSAGAGCRVCSGDSYQTSPDLNALAGQLLGLLSTWQASSAPDIPGLSGTSLSGIMPQGADNGIEQWWVQMQQGQEQYLQQVLEGLTELEGGFGGMFGNLLTTGNDTFDRLGGSLMKMGQGLLGGQTKAGGPLSFLGSAFSGVQSALGFLGPAGSIVSTGFSLLKGIGGLFGGRKTQQLASPLVNRSDYKPQPVSAPAQQAGRTVNVYINGQTLGSAVEVDRTLGRAGVDRRLRDQVKELVRSGANPVVS
jgi:hypothetical protein